MALKANGGGGRFHGEHMADINVTPLVDVMLVLLVIFMVTAPMMTTGVSVDLPQANAKPLPGNDEPLTITIINNGKVTCRKNEVQLKELQPKLVAIAGEKARHPHFRARDRLVDYGRVMQVVGEINAGGFNKVSLVTEAAPPSKVK